MPDGEGRGTCTRIGLLKHADGECRRTCGRRIRSYLTMPSRCGASRCSPQGPFLILGARRRHAQKKKTDSRSYMGRAERHGGGAAHASVGRGRDAAAEEVHHHRRHFVFFYIGIADDASSARAWACRHSVMAALAKALHRCVTYPGHVYMHVYTHVCTHVTC